MKKFPSEQLNFFVSNSFNKMGNICYLQAKHFRCTNKIAENIELLSNTYKNSIQDIAKISRASFTTEISNKYNSAKVWRKYFVFWEKPRNIPIKCKIRPNECGEKEAEPYVADKPSPSTIPQLSMDFTMNPEETCNKLQREMITLSPSPSAYMQSTPMKYTKAKFSFPNALTKYLKIKGKCSEVYKGVETDTSKKKTPCENTYIGGDCAPEDPCKVWAPYISKTQKKPTKKKSILKTLISRLKSKKLMKPSGFINEDLIQEACNKLRNIRSSTKHMTYVKNTSNREKSTDIVFRVQNLCRCYFSGASLLEKFLENQTYRAFETFLVQRYCLLQTLRNEETLLISSLRGMSKVIKSNQIQDTTEGAPEGEDKDAMKPKNTGKKIQKKTKNNIKIRRRCRRPRWFSRILIEPNVKGSVIFANGTAQELDDPCKILSANFSESNFPPVEDKIEVNPDEKRCKLVVEQLIDNYDHVVDKLKKQDDNKIDSRFHQKGLQIFGIHKQKHFKKIKIVNSNETDEMFRQRMEPMLRQKKISKLDNTVKCFTTAVLPEKQLRPKKRQKRTSKRSKSDLKQGSADNLNTSLLELNNYPLTLSSEAFDKGYHANTTNNLLNSEEVGNQKNNRRNNVVCAESDNSFVKIKEIGPMFESGDEKESLPSFNKNPLENHPLLLPGVTRPVTQKAAYLNLLESNMLTPVSNAWKKHSAHPMKIKDKGDKKKVSGFTNKPDGMEIKGVNYQQCRMNSTEKVAPSKCNPEKKPCQHSKKNSNSKANESMSLDWDYDAKVPDEVARKWFYWDCSKGKDEECPVTNEDVKRGYPHRNPPTAAAINRCNFEECKQRIRCRCRNTGSSKTNK